MRASEDRSGMLHLYIKAEIPRPTAPTGLVLPEEYHKDTDCFPMTMNSYDATHRMLDTRLIPVLEIKCTQDEAIKIAARWRSANGEAHTHAVWQGPLQL